MKKKFFREIVIDMIEILEEAEKIAKINHENEVTTYLRQQKSFYIKILRLFS